MLSPKEISESQRLTRQVVERGGETHDEIPDYTRRNNVVKDNGLLRVIANDKTRDYLLLGKDYDDSAMNIAQATHGFLICLANGIAPSRLKYTIEEINHLVNAKADFYEAMVLHFRNKLNPRRETPRIMLNVNSNTRIITSTEYAMKLLSGRYVDAQEIVLRRASDMLGYSNANSLEPASDLFNYIIKEEIVGIGLEMALGRLSLLGFKFKIK